MKWLLAVVLVMALILTLGCGANLPVAPTEEVAPAPVVSSNIVKLTITGISGLQDEDADPHVAGMELYIYPIDANNDGVEARGTVRVQLWRQKSEVDAEKAELIQTWTGISISEEDYEYVVGARIRLEYNFSVSEERKYGILEVTFTTSDGESFTATKEGIPIRA